MTDGGLDYTFECIGHAETMVGRFLCPICCSLKYNLRSGVLFFPRLHRTVSCKFCVIPLHMYA